VTTAIFVLTGRVVYRLPNRLPVK